MTNYKRIFKKYMAQRNELPVSIAAAIKKLMAVKEVGVEKVMAIVNEK